MIVDVESEFRARLHNGRMSEMVMMKKRSAVMEEEEEEEEERCAAGGQQVEVDTGVQMEDVRVTGEEAMLELMLRHCRDMKRQETRSRWATAFILTAFITLCLCLQVRSRSEPATQDAPKQERLEQNPPEKQRARQPKLSVHLLSQNNVVLQINSSYLMAWMMAQDSDKKFYLQDNTTSLVIPKKGLYLINLRINLRTTEKCRSANSTYISVKQYHDDYAAWRNVIESLETVTCGNKWFRAVTLSRAVRLNSGTKLIVSISENLQQFIRNNQNNFFGVTRL